MAGGKKPDGAHHAPSGFWHRKTFVAALPVALLLASVDFPQVLTGRDALHPVSGEGVTIKELLEELGGLSVGAAVISAPGGAQGAAKVEGVGVQPLERRAGDQAQG